MNSQKHHYILEYWQLFLFFFRQDNVNQHGYWSHIAKLNLILRNWVEYFDFHLRNIADIVSGIRHEEVEVEATKGIEKVKSRAIQVWMSFKFELELDFIGARRHLEDVIALTDSFIDYGEPLTL